MSEANRITADLLDELPKRYLRIRVWRNNRVKAMAIGRGGKPRMISAGIDGQADISGISGPLGRRVEIEVKAGSDTLSEAQRNFRKMILSLGGIYVVARSVEGGLKELDSQLKEEEREAYIRNLERGGGIRPAAGTRTKGRTEPPGAVRLEPDKPGSPGVAQEVCRTRNDETQ